jgi:hypothetical protein
MKGNDLVVALGGPMGELGHFEFFETALSTPLFKKKCTESQSVVAQNPRLLDFDSNGLVSRVCTLCTFTFTSPLSMHRHASWFVSYIHV